MRKIVIFFALFINIKSDIIPKTIASQKNKNKTIKISSSKNNSISTTIDRANIKAHNKQANKIVNKNKKSSDRYLGIPTWFYTLDLLLERSEIKAFLDTIAYAEGTLHSDGYRTMYGNFLFYNFRDHPRKINTAILGKKVVKSSAAGRYQILTKTWDGLNNKFNFQNFTPLTQDKAALALAREAGALNLILTGQIDKALVKLNKIWSSLPGAIYGQPTVKLDKLRTFYNQSVKYYRFQEV